MTWLPRYDQSNVDGFTLVELLVVVLVTSMLLGLTAITLGRPQAAANVSTSVDTLLADISGQQVLAMAGDTGSQTTAQTQGILFSPTQYTLFTGTYNAGDSYNFIVQLPLNATLANTFPSSQLIFNKGDGSVTNTGTITLTSGGASHTITVNRFGAPTVN